MHLDFLVSKETLQKRAENTWNGAVSFSTASSQTSESLWLHFDGYTWSISQAKESKARKAHAGELQTHGMRRVTSSWKTSAKQLQKTVSSYSSTKLASLSAAYNAVSGVKKMTTNTLTSATFTRDIARWSQQCRRRRATSTSKYTKLPSKKIISTTICGNWVNRTTTSYCKFL